MKGLKKLLRFLRILLFAFMLAVCMIIGVAPVLPKRKEPFAMEIKTEEIEGKENTISKFFK